MNGFTFVDLFAGIGAFHTALESIGGTCVFASEIDKYAAETYKENFNMTSLCDIREVVASDIPAHDVLCAGFPCQSFSKGGKMSGFSDTRGTLFFEIERILQHHKTKYIILENVKHLVNHDNGNTFSVITEHLKNLGYILTECPLILSPHQFGTPQKRERVYILGVHKSVVGVADYLNIKLPIEKEEQCSVYDVLDDDVDEKYNITKYEEKVLMAWDEFKGIVGNLTGPIFFDELFKDSAVCDKADWRYNFIVKGCEIYLSHKSEIDAWSLKWDVYSFKIRDRKFEWQAGSDICSVWETVIQLRPSGIRCKRPNYFPTLVAMVQTPIIGKYRRRITPREAARLQSFPESYKLNSMDRHVYKQLGNSANVEIITYVAQQLLLNITKN